MLTRVGRTGTPTPRNATPPPDCCRCRRLPLTRRAENAPTLASSHWGLKPPMPAGLLRLRVATPAVPALPNTKKAYCMTITTNYMSTTFMRKPPPGASSPGHGPRPRDCGTSGTRNSARTRPCLLEPTTYRPERPSFHAAGPETCRASPDSFESGPCGP